MTMVKQYGKRIAGDSDDGNVKTYMCGSTDNSNTWPTDCGDWKSDNGWSTQGNYD